MAQTFPRGGSRAASPFLKGHLVTKEGKPEQAGTSEYSTGHVEKWCSGFPLLL